jgi:hypothetical protein
MTFYMGYITQREDSHDLWRDGIVPIVAQTKRDLFRELVLSWQEDQIAWREHELVPEEGEISLAKARREGNTCVNWHEFNWELK